jgi:hypothetical protein
LSNDNLGQNQDIKIANRSFENVAELKYFGMTVTNHNFIQDEIKRKLKFGNACSHSVQNLWPARIYKATNFACGSVWV